jgi:hypothetical protein
MKRSEQRESGGGAWLRGKVRADALTVRGKALLCGAAGGSRAFSFSTAASEET